MPKFTANVHVHRESGPVFFAEGDEVPEWAAPLVGTHVTDSEQEPEADEPEADADEETDAPADKADAEPDFTAPAPRRGRPRKS